MKILNFHRYHRPDCNKCKSNGYYYVFPVPETFIHTANPFKLSQQMGNKPHKIYCSCEWGKELSEKRKEINDLPFDNPLKNMTDDEIRESLQPLNPTYIQSLSKEEFEKLAEKNWKLAYQHYLEDRDKKIFENKEKQHIK